MINDNIKFISVQPRSIYYVWQVEVMINNFMKHGINPNNIEILVSIHNDNDTQNPLAIEMWNKLANHYNYVRIFFYKDTRVNPRYLSSIRPNILKQHFSIFPELKNYPLFYHDCDMIFTKPPLILNELINDNIWYLSDCEFYIGANYILEKGEDIYNKMCEIVGLYSEVPKMFQKSSGGAQYLMKNLTKEYWEKVEKDCESLYEFFLEDEPKKLSENPTYHPIQKWTADMWAVLWNAWHFGYETKVHPELEFIWPTYGLQDWDKYFIYHNAGILNTMSDTHFYKGNYMYSLPYDIKEENFINNLCTIKYVQEIIETSKKSCLI